MLSVLSLNHIFLSIYPEFVLMIYLLGLISYAVFFTNLKSFSFPFLLKSSSVFSTFVLLSLLFLLISFDF